MSTSDQPARPFSPVWAWTLLVLLISFSALPWMLGDPQGLVQNRVRQLPQIRFQVDINQASVPELQAIPSIGPKLADNIDSHRKTHGRFSRIEDLQQIPGLSQKLVGQIKPYLTLEDRQSEQVVSGTEVSGDGKSKNGRSGKGESRNGEAKIAGRAVEVRDKESPDSAAALVQRVD